MDLDEITDSSSPKLGHKYEVPAGGADAPSATPAPTAAAEVGGALSLVVAEEPPASRLDQI